MFPRSLFPKFFKKFHIFLRNGPALQMEPGHFAFRAPTIWRVITVRISVSSFLRYGMKKSLGMRSFFFDLAFNTRIRRSINMKTCTPVDKRWLRYFNDTAFLAGLISEQERDLIQLRILTGRPVLRGYARHPRQHLDSAPIKSQPNDTASG